MLLLQKHPNSALSGFTDRILLRMELAILPWDIPHIQCPISILYTVSYNSMQFIEQQA